MGLQVSQSAAVFSGPDRLMVVDRATRVTEYHMTTNEVERRYEPKLGLAERTYRYGINPLYTVFPKPGEFDTTIQYLLTGQQTRTTPGAPSDLGARREKLEPWKPVWSSLVFAAVVLALGCVYVQRREF